MIRAIIFDMFGVIRPDNLLATYQHFGGDPVADAQFINDTINASNKGAGPRAREVFAKHFGITPEAWMAVFDHESGNDPQTLRFILALREHYKVGLLTNVSAGRLPDLFQPGELEKYFDATAASGDIGYAKPEAVAYETIADRLGVRLDECIMVDDRAEYCEGARAVGMQAILYASLESMKRELEKLLQP